MAGQSINDRFTAARYSLAGQGLARSVCKATTEEVMGPKKKHLDYLLHCTNEANVSIPQLANLLIERTASGNWVVVFKALVTVHHLMCYGNERFTQYLASSNCSFQLSNFLDKSGYEMSTSIRRYSKYLNEKALSYRTVAFDFCKVKRGKSDGMLRTMDAEKLLKTVPVLQSQIDALLDFDCSANELTNGVINSCFMLLFRDLIRLFACYNDGIINLLEKYFDMNKKNCRDALDLYKKFLIRMDRVAEFLKVAESVGIDKGDIPDLAKAPSSLLDALEAHLENLEGKKGTTTSSHVASLKSAVTAFSNTSSAFGSVSTGTSAAGSAPIQSGSTTAVNGVKVDDNLKKMVLEEENAVLEQHKKDLQQAVEINDELVSTERRLKELQSNVPKSTNPFLSSPSAEPQILQQQQPTTTTVDLLGAGSPPSNVVDGKAIDDLLCLSGNPFADSVLNARNQQSTIPQPSWGTNGFANISQTTAVSNSSCAFVNDNAFAAAFGDQTQPSTGMTSTSPAPPPSSPAAAAPPVPLTPPVTTLAQPLDSSNVSSNLHVTVSEPQGGRSMSPSPTQPMESMMKGAGTTPILTHGPDPTFGDVTPTHEECGVKQPVMDLFIGGSSEVETCGKSFSSDFQSSFVAPNQMIVNQKQPDLFCVNESDVSKASSLADFDLMSGSIGDSSTMSPPMRSSHSPVPAKISAFDELTSTMKMTMSAESPSLPRVTSPIPPTLSSTGIQSMNVMTGKTSPNPVIQGYMGSPAKPGMAMQSSTGSGFDAFGDILQPQSGIAAKTSPIVDVKDGKQQTKTKVMTGDLDSSLASLVQNLGMNDPRSKGKSQWNSSPKNLTKTGGANWSVGGSGGMIPGSMTAHGTGTGWTGQPNTQYMGMARQMTAGGGSPMVPQQGGLVQQGMQKNVMMTATNQQTVTSTSSPNQYNSDPFGNL